MFTFEPIEIAPHFTPEMTMWAHRLNGFGSSFYFTKVILKRKRLNTHLHLPICLSLEKEHLKDVKEYPRDHFKSTIACEGMPIWRILPFGDEDELMFRKFHAEGYFRCYDIDGVEILDEFCRWMRKIHDPRLRNLLVSENLQNAAKLGTRITRHFESNAFFRTMYPEILPATSERWSITSMQIRMPNADPDPHGEGTFDFIGVGGALQSRHYNGLLIQDDLVGRKAVESPVVMDKAIDYHQLLVGVFDNDDAHHESDELVIGNRWGFHDLNSHIREHEPWFLIESHGALGGCCDLHPHGVPIFREEFSVEKLEKLKRRLGSYKFSCQFLNDPCSQEDAEWQPQWLLYYNIKTNSVGEQYVVHDVADGVIRRDIPVSHLRKVIISDPAHAENAGKGRCRHAIIVLGMSDEGNYYLLDAWAKACSYDAYFHQLFDMLRKWNLHRVGFETVAAQKFAAYHIGFLAAQTGWRVRIDPLKGEVENEDGTLTKNKTWRIKNVLTPIFEFGRFFCQKRFQDFIGEYNTFPRGRFVDQLDCAAYAPQLLRAPRSRQNMEALKKQNRQMSKIVGANYSIGAAGGSRIYTM